MSNNVTHPEQPIEYPTPPDVLQAAKNYEPGDSDKTMMTVRRFPVFLRQGLEALSRDGAGSMERTVVSPSPRIRPNPAAVLTMTASGFFLI